jgi:hypothetical protein
MIISYFIPGNIHTKISFNLMLCTGIKMWEEVMPPLAV